MLHTCQGHTQSVSTDHTGNELLNMRAHGENNDLLVWENRHLRAILKEYDKTSIKRVFKIHFTLPLKFISSSQICPRKKILLYTHSYPFYLPSVYNENNLYAPHPCNNLNYSILKKNNL